jgi:hypothetical protein
MTTDRLWVGNISTAAVELGEFYPYMEDMCWEGGWTLSSGDWGEWMEEVTVKAGSREWSSHT